MALEVQSALIGAFVTVAVMTSMLLRRRRRRTDVLFSILASILTLWFLAVFLRGEYGDDPWLRIEMGIAALIPAALLKLFADLVPGTTVRRRVLMSASYPLSAIVALAAVSPLGNLDGVQIATSVYIGVVTLLASRFIVESRDVPKGTIEYARRRYLAIGSALAVTLAIAGEVPMLRGSMTAAGHLTIMLYVLFLSQILLRERLLDLNEFVGRTMILGALALLFAGIFAVLVGLGGNVSSRLFNAVIGVIILITLYEPLKDRLEAKT